MVPGWIVAHADMFRIVLYPTVELAYLVNAHVNISNDEIFEEVRS